MPTPTDAERAYIERLSTFLEMAGSPRMMGRLLAWLLICDPPQQSITELSEALGVSKASVSTVIRQMEQGHMVERAPVPGSRQHYYQLLSGGWARVTQARLTLTTKALEAFDEGLAAVGDDPRRRARLEEMRDFFEFVRTEFGEQFVERWQRYRDRCVAERAGHRGPRLAAVAGRAHGDPSE